MICVHCHNGHLLLRSELSGRCPSSNSSPTAEEKRYVQVRNVIMKCTRAWTMAQEYLKVNVWGQCTLMEQQILGEKFIFKKLPESNFKSTGNYKGSTGQFSKENDYQAFDVLLFHRVVNIDTGKSPVSLLYSLIKLFKKKQSKCLYGKLNEINTRSRKD